VQGLTAVALDLGSTAIKAGLLARDGTLTGIVSRPAPPVSGEGGRYESAALAYAETADAVLAQCLAQTIERPPLGLCSQRSSFLLWERQSGKPVTPLISWQDERGAAACAELRGQEMQIRALTGLLLTPYYFAPKLRVLLQQNPKWRARLLSGEWLVGTLDTFLIWRWTHGAQHVTDASMAARTLLLDVGSVRWSPLLCELFAVPVQSLPQVLPSAGSGLALDNGLILQASLGDQSAALLASLEADRPQAMVNLGTGGFVACPLPEGRAVLSGYLRTLVWQDGAGRPHFACEGTLNSIGVALADYPAADCDPAELGSDDIYCLAEPSGLGAPYFRGDLGVCFSASVAHLPAARIALLLQEAVIFRVARMLEEMQHAFGIERAYLAGGLSNLPCLQQGIARCAPCAIFFLQQPEAGLFGTAQLAAGGYRPGRQAVPVDGGVAGAGLVEKFGRWKHWLEGLLASGSAGSQGRAISV
jgi:glycerol kinase